MEMNTLSSMKMQGGDREERRYSVPNHPANADHHGPLPPAASEDLHAWSIYRQNLNSDFTDSALGSSDKSPLPYGNFQLRDTTVQSILNHPRYGPKSPLGSNMYTYLKFGLPRVFPPNGGGGSQRSHHRGQSQQPQQQQPQHHHNNHHQQQHQPQQHHSRAGHVNRGYRDSSAGAAAAASSGYDSSDNENPRAKSNNGGRIPSNLRKFRSESDFRAMNGGGGGGGGRDVNDGPGGGRGGAHSRNGSQLQPGNNIPLAALRMANSRASIAGTHPHNPHNQGMNYPGKHYGNRSHSEADLLGNEVYDYDMRNTLSRSRQDLHAPKQQQAYHQQQTSSRRASMVHNVLAYPNIQVHALDALPSLRGISLEAKAGELFAVMATSQREGSILMETLGGLRERVSGEILVNGQQITQRGLQSVCSFVPAPDKSSLDARMSVQSTLSFHAALCGPSNTSDLKERVDILVDDLGLTAVRTANVSRLTHSEKQRLSLACQLLTEASILILDQATTNMDIFDTFFLVEYLRQWCNTTGRIVIMTLQPPTFEILSMCSGVLLLSGGRTIFSGSRSDLPRHMGSLGYPCPPFKNPADYYLDLVTLDDLSAAAMLESSARIESLANAWEHTSANEIHQQMAPPAPLPNFTRHAGFCGQLVALSKRFIVYKQPNSLLAWISKLIAAAVLSLFIGCIFWDVPATDPQLDLNDRLGYHHCMMAVAFWPLILLTIRDIHDDRMYAEKDIKLGMYGRTIYIMVQLFWNLMPSLCIWLAYLLPAHSMAGLYTYSAGSDTGIYMFMGYMLLYLTVVQSLAQLCAHIFSTKITSAVATALLMVLTTASGGFSIHLGQRSAYWSWTQYISPQRWLLPLLTEDEYSAETLSNTAGHHLCRNKQVQHQEIIVQHPCPTPNGTAILADLQLLAQPHAHAFGVDSASYADVTVIALFAALACLFVLTTCVFVSNVRRLCRAKTMKNQAV